MHLIGSDPEFLVYSVDSKERICANHLYDDFHLRKRIGYDGCIDTGEFRPRAENDPIEHYNSLYRLVRLSYKRLRKKRNDLIMVGGSGYGYSHGASIGGHIHFNIKSYSKIDKAVSSLDVLLSIPMLFIEQYPNNTRRRSNYGFGCYRHNYHGFEYRTPCSFILEPNITKGVYCLAYAIAFDNIELPETLLNLRSRQHNREYYYAFKDCEKSKFRPYLNKIINHIYKLKLYSSLKNEIDYLISRIDEPWNESINVWYSYGLSNIKDINSDPQLTLDRFSGNK